MLTDTAIIQNRYRILREIGRGGMGIVYLVEDTFKDNMHLALKTIKHDITLKKRDHSIDKFKHEYEVMTRLKHPNLTRVYEFGIDKNNYYIIMEYLNGSLLSDKQFNFEQSIDITVQILRALEYIHSRNIVYRDIKPGNIILSGESVKLMDFGLAGSAGNIDSKISGTLFYMPPEALNHVVGFSFDIFSLGILFYELSTKRRFFEYSELSTADVISLLESVEDYNRHQYKMLSYIGNANLGKIIRKMTSYYSIDRYDDCAEIIADINDKLGFDYEYETLETKKSYVLGNSFADRSMELQSLKANIVPGVKNKFHICSGSSGIGKTRLFYEFKKDCILNDILFFDVACMEGKIRKYHSLAELLSQMILQSSAGLLSSYGRYLKLLLPNHSMLDRFKPPVLNNNPEVIQSIIIYNTSEFIIEFAKSAGTKVILYFNDFQWIDYGSSLVIKNLLERLSEDINESSDLLLYASYDKDRKHAGVWLDDLFSMHGISIYELHPFDLDGVKDYIYKIFGEKCLDASIINSAGLMKHKVGGRPLFLQELIKSLLDRDIIRKDKRYWKLLKPLEDEHVPGNVLAVIQHKIDILFQDENRRKILRLLSFLRIDPDLETIKVMTEKIVKSDTVKLLLELENLEVIHSFSVDNVIYYTYVNSIFKDKIRDSVADKTGVHLFIAESLEALYGKVHSDFTEEIAYHYLQGLEKEKAVFYYEKCGDNARESYFTDKAIHYYEISLGLITDTDKESMAKKAGIDIKLGQQLDLKGKWADSLAVYKEALKISEKLLNNELITSCLIGLGGISHKLGDSIMAESFLSRALIIANKTGNGTLLGDSMHRLGIIHYDCGAYEKSMHCYEEALRIFSHTGDENGIAKCCNSMGNYYWSICEYDKSMECYERNLQHCERIDDRFGIGSALCNMANICWATGDYDKMMSYYEKALKICEDIGDKYVLAVNIGNIGVFYYYIGEYDKAMEYYQQSLSIYRELGHKRGTVYSYGNIGLVYYQKGYFFKALKYLDKSIGISRQINNPFTLCEQLYNKANILYELQRTEESEYINAEAIKIAHEINRHDIIVKSNILKNKTEKNEKALLKMLENKISEEQNARIYYNLWIISSKEKYREKAGSLYENLLNKFFKIEYKQRFEELQHKK